MRDNDFLATGMPMPVMMELLTTRMAATTTGPAATIAPAARELCYCYYAFNTLIMHGSGLQVLSTEWLQMMITFEIILGRSVKRKRKKEKIR